MQRFFISPFVMHSYAHQNSFSGSEADKRYRLRDLCLAFYKSHLGRP
jgi:hypothetical protein